jgi:hypothetical protein
VIHKIYIEKVTRHGMYHVSRNGQDVGVYSNPLSQIADEMIKVGETGRLELWDHERPYPRISCNLDARRAAKAKAAERKAARQKAGAPPKRKMGDRHRRGPEYMG